ncbi:hypothetical protein HYH03_003553 [Edaphochlamys debaryana]|uniref:Right handed beta helix domain-containing protein n=1 Tax=Edaphochlamys debaryana TaxID=47281 RepID=A0A835YB90_9CHLO|nr:hypothetical protein HYH03_003553 [Edaphochlamys debaryana]|eukprot:KAG2498292.1 hypothetical protein HYH03_003553 [Edaphochlamys debaryana]
MDALLNLTTTELEVVARFRKEASMRAQLEVRLNQEKAALSIEEAAMSEHWLAAKRLQPQLASRRQRVQELEEQAARLQEQSVARTPVIQGLKERLANATLATAPETTAGPAGLAAAGSTPDALLGAVGPAQASAGGAPQPGLPAAPGSHPRADHGAGPDAAAAQGHGEAAAARAALAASPAVGAGGSRQAVLEVQGLEAGSAPGTAPATSACGAADPKDATAAAAAGGCPAGPAAAEVPPLSGGSADGLGPSLRPCAAGLACPPPQLQGPQPASAAAGAPQEQGADGSGAVAHSAKPTAGQAPAQVGQKCQVAERRAAAEGAAATRPSLQAEGRQTRCVGQAAQEPSTSMPALSQPQGRASVVTGVAELGSRPAEPLSASSIRRGGDGLTTAAAGQPEPLAAGGACAGAVPGTAPPASIKAETRRGRKAKPKRNPHHDNTWAGAAAIEGAATAEAGGQAGPSGSATTNGPAASLGGNGEAAGCSAGPCSAAAEGASGEQVQLSDTGVQEGAVKRAPPVAAAAAREATGTLTATAGAGATQAGASAASADAAAASAHLELPEAAPGPLLPPAPALPLPQPADGSKSAGAGAGGARCAGNTALETAEAEAAAGAGGRSGAKGCKRAREATGDPPQQLAPQAEMQAGTPQPGRISRAVRLQHQLDSLAKKQPVAAAKLERGRGASKMGAAALPNTVVDLGGRHVRGDFVKVPSGLTRITISNGTIEGWVLVEGSTDVTFDNVTFLGEKHRASAKVVGKLTPLDVVTVAGAGASVKLVSCTVRVACAKGEAVNCVSVRAGARAELRGCTLGPGPKHGLVVLGGATALAVDCIASELDVPRKNQGTGLLAAGPGSRLRAERCTAERCGDRGFASADGGALEVGDGCVARGCRYGFTADSASDAAGSTLVAGAGCEAHGAAGSGWRVQDGATLTTGPDCKAVRCTVGFAVAGVASTMTLGRGCSAKENGDGFTVGEGALLDLSAGGCVAEANTGHGFLAELGGELRLGPGSQALSNGGDGVRASEGSVVVVLRPGSQAEAGAQEGEGEARQAGGGGSGGGVTVAAGNQGAGFRAAGASPGEVQGVSPGVPSRLELPEGGWRAHGNAGGDEPLAQEGGRVEGADGRTE